LEEQQKLYQEENNKMRGGRGKTLRDKTDYNNLKLILFPVSSCFVFPERY
jgi:hypothetical protein